MCCNYNFIKRILQVWKDREKTDAKAGVERYNSVHPSARSCGTLQLFFARTFSHVLRAKKKSQGVELGNEANLVAQNILSSMEAQGSSTKAKNLLTWNPLLTPALT